MLIPKFLGVAAALQLSVAPKLPDTPEAPPKNGGLVVPNPFQPNDRKQQPPREESKSPEGIVALEKSKLGLALSDMDVRALIILRAESKEHRKEATKAIERYAQSSNLARAVASAVFQREQYEEILHGLDVIREFYGGKGDGTLSNAMDYFFAAAGSSGQSIVSILKLWIDLRGIEKPAARPDYSEIENSAIRYIKDFTVTGEIEDIRRAQLITSFPDASKRTARELLNSDDSKAQTRGSYLLLRTVTGEQDNSARHTDLNQDLVAAFGTASEAAVRRNCCLTLNLLPSTKESISALIQATKDANPLVREAAIPTTVRGPLPGEFIRAISALLNDNDVRVKKAAISFLCVNWTPENKEIGEEVRKAVDGSLSKENDGELRDYFKRQLEFRSCKIPGKEALVAEADHSQSRDSRELWKKVSEYGSWALGTIGTLGALGILVGYLRLKRHQQNPEGNRKG